MMLYVSLIFTVLLVGALTIILMKSSYADVMRDNLDDSILYSLKMLQVDRDVWMDDWVAKDPMAPRAVTWDSAWVNSDNNQFKQKFISYLTGSIDSRVTSLDVSFYGVDSVNGMLSVEVTANFRYPTGVSGSVTTQKTVILEKEVK